MDHFSLQKAHIHGYSMGGASTAQLLAHHPERFITAALAGSGIRELDPEWVVKVPKDEPVPIGSKPRPARVWAGRACRLASRT
ncbi:MAG: alpha/beta fold hydrolase [Bryobacteraceae bacterium]